jgi:hypothetical protein
VGPLERWLKQNIQFDLDEEDLAGLRLHLGKAAAMGLIPLSLSGVFRRRASDGCTAVTISNGG